MTSAAARHAQRAEKCLDEALSDTIHECERLASPSRELDAKIAVAVFPALADLPALAPGIWRHEDGSRIRALRYSSSWSAAATLPAAGHWIDVDQNTVRVSGPNGVWTASHPDKTIALCLASLLSRAVESGNGR